MMDMVQTYFSLGSNLGERRKNILSSVALMEEYFSLRATALSSIIETQPWGFESEDAFLNCAVRFDFPLCGISPSLHAHAILRLCKEIEKSLGREVHEPIYDKEGRRIYSSRPIDIDILLYGEERVTSPVLIIPHPLMSQRAFVMEPLLEIASDKVKEAFGDIFQKWL